MNQKTWCACIAAGIMLTGCAQKSEQPAPKVQANAMETEITIGGKKAVRLTQPQSADAAKPQIIEAEILPGRGMNIYQLKAYVPGKGVVNMMPSPSLEEAHKLMNNGEGDEYGNQGFKIGGGILVPFANRIRGKLSADSKTLETMINGKKIMLDANWKGKEPKAIPHAMHGLILGTAMDSAKTESTPDAASVVGVLNAGDFRGHWPSKTELTIKTTLQKSGSFRFDVTAKNVGEEDLPMGIGWHPYFSFPSGNREQVRVRIPAKERALVNNYDDVFPTGKVVPVAGTKYDFSAPGGAPLDKLFLDDCWLNVQKDAQGRSVAEIIDPAAKYGIRITSISPEINAFQAYAPVDKQFIAFEPQFNLADPYSPIWKGQKTGMAVIKPGQSVTYSVELELFVP